MIDWLDRVKPDVVALQETKMADDDFAEKFDEDLFRRGYQVAHHGDGRWNGVAILSKIGLDSVRRGFAGDPGFPEPEPRAVSAVCNGVTVWSVYVPNGRSPDDPHYAYKLQWLQAFRDVVALDVAAGPVVVMGDVNVARTDADVWDPADFTELTHVTPPERAAIDALEALGLVDVVRRRWPTETVYSYWDYRAGMFHKNLGMRIDLILASTVLADRGQAAWIDRAARKGTGPSDHAPVIFDVDAAPDGDIGPMVPPPSAPRR
jgi:exodeoxyribonuclease-3